MEKIISWFGGRNYALAALLIFLIAAFLRLYKLEEFATFLGDQGRDAIIMKNIATFKDLPALGPITSVGSVYLGPFYYYLMAPWLLLFGLNPVGPAYGVAFISIIGIILQYFAVKDVTDRLTALLSILFTTFSWVLIEYARFSWNPNLLAPIAFFAMYALVKAVRTNRIIWYLLLGGLVSCALQLHYLSLFLLPFSAIIVLYYAVKDKKTKWSRKLVNIFAAGLSFGAVYAPFILFEFIHQFPNTNSLLRFVTDNNTRESASKINEAVDTTIKVFTYSFQIDLAQNGGAAAAVVTAVIYIVILWWNHNRVKKSDNAMMVFAAAFFVLLLGTSLYHGTKYPHYLGSLYILLYVLTAYILRLGIKYAGGKIGTALSAMFILGFIVLNGTHFIFLWQANGGHNQIARSRAVSRAVADMKPRAPYTLTSSPQAYTDYPYRYYLDAWGLKPVPKEEDSYIETKDLFVLCDEKCEPMQDSQWAIAHFSPKKITDEKKVEGVYIYRLTK